MGDLCPGGQKALSVTRHSRRLQSTRLEAAWSQKTKEGGSVSQINRAISPFWDEVFCSFRHLNPPPPQAKFLNF